MIVTLKDLVVAPRLWLSAGVFCLGASVAIGYHQDQMAAENTLAQKISLPEKVRVQDFSSARHENQLNEVNIIAEVALDRSVRIDVGTAASPKILGVVPIYPVSRDSVPIARSILHDRRRPVARKDAEKVASQNEQLKVIESVPVGLLVLEDETISSEALFSSLTEGRNGPLVDVSGVLVGGENIILKAEDALAEKGVALITGAIVVSPYLHGRAFVDAADHSEVRQTLFWMALGMFAFGGASFFKLLPAFGTKQKASVASQVKAVSSFPAVDPFQPIADQEDIVDENAPSRRVSRALSVAVDTFRSKSRL